MRIQQLVTLVKTQFSKVINASISNNSKELAMTQFIQYQDIIHQYAFPYRPEQN